MTLCVSPQQAASELLRRKRAQRSLIDYANAIDVPGKPASDDPNEWLFRPIETTVAAHHRLLMTQLQRVAHGEISRLMVFMPPGSAKSTYTSVVFPTWYMGWKPGARIILASYASDIARKQGRRARQIVRSRAYAPIFGTTISNDTSAADEWALTNGSEFMAGGILSGLTGNRANGIIIDDPVAGREAADSETIRKKTKETYEDDVRTRLIPGGFEILVQTRWHQKDLAGSILPKKWAGESGPIMCRDGKVWQVICLPAIAERADDPLGREIGMRLWPEWFTKDHFDTFRKQSRTWAALFQQRPTDPEGTYYRREWFRIIEPGRLPQMSRAVRAWDLAATTVEESDDPDWLAGVKMSKGVDGRYYIRHVHRVRTTPSGVESAIKQFGMSDRRDVAIRIEQEGAASGKIVKHYFERMMDGWDCRFTGIPRGSKLTRSKPFNAACERGDVLLVEGDWNEDFLDEVVKFPQGAHDDMCLVAGTMIRTAYGERPIETIAVGDKVLTRGGLSRVAWAGMTSESSPVVSVRLSNGFILTGTSNHPIFTVNRGFIALDAIHGADILFACESISPRAPLTPLSLRESGFTDIRTQNESRSFAITIHMPLTLRQVWVRYIKRSGSRLMGQFQRGARFITLTATRLTIPSATSNASLQDRTGGYMLLKGYIASRRSLNTLRRLAARLRRGIDLLLEGRGTEIMQNLSPLLAGFSRPTVVPIAEQVTRRSTQAITSSAASLAVTDIASGTTPSKGFAGFAKLSSIPREESPADSVRVLVPAVPSGRAAVFNLKVEGMPEFFANGVLVHNCDAAVGAYTELAGGLSEWEEETVASALSYNDRD